MARDKGRDNPARAKKRKALRREVYVFTEGEVTEPGFITFVTGNGTRGEPRHEIVCTVENRSAPQLAKLRLIRGVLTGFLTR
jgi:hypothetical protein